MSDVDPSPALALIPRDECIRLLATQHVGRLAVVDGDQPLIFPVNYVADGDHVVIRTAEGSKLDSSKLRRVAFEVDHIDPELREGWSVVVQGIGHEITTALDPLSERLRSLTLDSWAGGERGHWIRIDAHHVTGRRLWSTRPVPPGA
jgi:nitroimidazol reductase NimA-like FMN-containing flavoprotein (pyridoxamine 5'-phosphate oxidase superfamily)